MEDILIGCVVREAIAWGFTDEVLPNELDEGVDGVEVAETNIIYYNLS